MTGLPIVRTRPLKVLLAALGDGRAIAVPGDGGYLLAVRLTAAPAAAALRAAGVLPEEEASLHIAVGAHAHAHALSPAWSRETSLLTDRMWPGPLLVIVPPAVGAEGKAGSVLRITMPGSRALRALARESGPLAVIALRGNDGGPLVTPGEVTGRLAAADVAFVLDGGVRSGAGPTVVDCTVSPPQVRQVGALPESFVDAALMMARRRRRWFAKRTESAH